MNKWFTSSANPNDLALTLKGALLALVPLILTALQSYNVQATNNEVVDAIEAIFGVVSAVLVVAGMLRKFYFYWHDRNLKP